jgi:hypothetical protein
VSEGEIVLREGDRDLLKKGGSANEKKENAMKRKISFIVAAIWLSMMVIPSAGSPETVRLSGETTYDLGIERSRETQFYIHTGEIVEYSPDGSRVRKSVYRLYLKADPVRIDGKDTVEYTCVRFVIQPDGAKETSLPSIENWRYVPVMGIDGKNQIFGIDHSLFRNLTDSEGNVLSFDKAYQVFNTFVDFHGFTSVFADPVSTVCSIQDLHRVGEKIIHFTANSSAPVHLGESVSEGSFFKNGEITLEFKGLSVVNGCPCALVGMDSGESSLKMTMKPTQDLKIMSTGGSHYKGDLYKDLASGWVQKAVFNEIVVTEAIIPALSQKIHSVLERNILIRNVDKSQFEKR